MVSFSFFPNCKSSKTTCSSLANKIYSSLRHRYCHRTKTEIIRLQTLDTTKEFSECGHLTSSKRVYTTHTPTSLRLREIWEMSKYGKGIVIGIMDTGIAIRHPCFHDTGVPPPPNNWKGKCDLPWGNNKVIRAINLLDPIDLPFDEEGHGTFVASVAAGNFVQAFDRFGNAIGEASGMAPLAHLAIYKAFGTLGCTKLSIRSALKTAINDGVDVITIAFGLSDRPAFSDDVIMTGSLLATYEGITVVCTAGNYGPSRSTLTNEAPWVLTVGAATKRIGIATPTVASFSSRGPNSVSPGILKPDIIGPGVHIFGALNEESKATFVRKSGTSVACPHLSGIAALLKNVHPDWSPAAIKSAIMTTADPVKDERGVDADVFAVGAGHVNPSKAVDPGLVFDIQPEDYTSYLLGLGYTRKNVGSLVGKTPSSSKVIAEAELNLPSFAIALRPGEKKKYTRTVTNVGKVVSVYNIESISSPVGLTVEVVPEELEFNKINDKLMFEVTFTRENNYEVMETQYVQGSMIWGSGKYSVRIPFSVKYV